MFGLYRGDIAYSDNDTSITAARSGSLPRYTRICGEEQVEKILPGREGTIIINPVEPVNLPVPVTRFLEITFSPIVLPSRAVRRIYLTFPLEIGVFLEAGSAIHMLDLFSLVPVKYSLYGSPGAGQITRWHASGISDVPLETDRFRWGILDLTISNTTAEFLEVSRAVFDSNSMHLWYGESVVMAGTMDVYSPLIARTYLSDIPPSAGMTRCIELYAAAKLPSVHGRGNLMEFGVT